MRSTRWLLLESWNYFYQPLVSCPGCSTGAFGQISRIFSVKVNSNPEVDSTMECHGSVRVRKVFMWRWRQVAFSRELNTQVMSSCKSISPVTACCIERCGVAMHTHQVVSENNNNNNLKRLRFNRRGASTPLWGVEACSPPSRWPNPIPAIPPYVVRTPHLHGAPTTEETVKL